MMIGRLFCFIILVSRDVAIIYKCLKIETARINEVNLTIN